MNCCRYIIFKYILCIVLVFSYDYLYCRYYYLFRLLINSFPKYY